MSSFYGRKESLWRDSSALRQHVWVYVDKYQLLPGWEISSFPQTHSSPVEPPRPSSSPFLPLLRFFSIAWFRALIGVSRRCFRLIAAPLAPSRSATSLFPPVFILSYLLIISPRSSFILHASSLSFA